MLSFHLIFRHVKPLFDNRNGIQIFSRTLIIMIWPEFYSALIVGWLAPLGLHNTRFRSVRVSCSPRTGADASSPRHETHRNVASSSSARSRKGWRRQTSSVLYAPSALSAMALSYESPTVPVEGSMPNSPTLVVYTRLMHCAPCVFCQVGVGRFGVSFSPCERRVSGRFGVGRSCWLLVIALVIA